MTLWGGRFETPPDEAMWRFTVDVSDRRLLAVDVAGSTAHATMIYEAGLIDDAEHTALTGGLARVAAEAAAGEFEWRATDEDVHTAVERRLGELVGDVAGKLHTGRSRNDQVALDLRLYLREAAAERATGLSRFASMLVDKAEEAGERIVAAYTHLQQAQAVPLAHHLLAYAWMLLRDRGRFGDVARRLDESPLGAGAAAGSSLPLDPDRVAGLLGFGSVFANSLDAVGSRDTVAEYVFCCAQAMTHLSRLAEEVVLWATDEFGWAEVDDAHATGSSALPHKKNPDIAELVRGKAATLVGDLAAVLALQKGLPLAYNRDLQEDKRLVFHADDVLAGALDAFGAMVAAMTITPPGPGPWVGALDLAEALVARGVPFREAHHAVGRLVATLVVRGASLTDATDEDLTTADPRFEHGDADVVSPTESVRSRTTSGAGSHASVAAQIGRLRELLS